VALSAHFSVTLTFLVQLFNAPRVTAHRLACLFDTCSAVCFFMHGAKFGADLHALFERITTSICVFLLLVALCSTLSGTPIECSASPVSRATSFLQFLRLEDHSIALISFASFYSKTFDSNTSIRFIIFQDSTLPHLIASDKPKPKPNTKHIQQHVIVGHPP